ncbi:MULTISPECIES: FeoA family protein [Thermosipho]|uniref:Iron transporter FeoA n=1 Tax=Thermosipho affectus TaxID=660294 RepID=A0ABX3ILF1_9BACT|nr:MULTISPECIES: FeoA family protein [Thermosipho]ANQ52962.1 iron transporter FeoA [Thermosipho sp. 1070]APT71409.1 iron transporter FeoA [Thermosipho sp. 1063]MBT1248743.1 iron transporter FeoA [Thermosipho sp. 1244]ONN28114.1 iron transporter FeoA [Thermosipho affectus]OOC46064.1 iron transporter FeoA [Thermosipho sp. 1074]
MTLDQVPECTKVKILSIMDSNIRNRILGLGIVPGSVVEVVRTSPMGDPRMYRVFNKTISLRNSEANLVEVELLNDSIPLIFASDGEYIVEKLCGGRMFRVKVEKLGVSVGVKLKISNGELYIHEKKVVIGSGMKRKIILRRG